MKTLNDEGGYAIVIALLMLSVLTVIGLVGIRTTITEQYIATNHQITRTQTGLENLQGNFRITLHGKLK